jgi:hypothetical protein
MIKTLAPAAREFWHIFQISRFDNLAQFSNIYYMHDKIAFVKI